MTGHPPSDGVVLATVRFQETDQRTDEAADAIVAFLQQGQGRIVDTADTPDDTREIRLVGYVTSSKPPEPSDP